VQPQPNCETRQIRPTLTTTSPPPLVPSFTPTHMPDIPVGAQIFDLVFHPNHSTVYTGLLTGEIKAFTYDDQGQYEDSFSLRPSKRSCRGLSIDQDGTRLWAVGKAKSLLYVSLYLYSQTTGSTLVQSTIDTAHGKLSDSRAGAHE
jgi:WD repeat-containing protein 55